MRVLNFDEFKLEKDYLLEQIINGAIFIYPTDTIYGIGCNAQLSKSVKKIREIKQRSTNPFSVIVPSILWIQENCIVTREAEEWIDKLPGPYTLIFKLKNHKCIALDVNPGLKTLGIRIPNHWIKNIVAEAEIPLVTTSVNRSSEDYMTSLEDLDYSIKKGIDFMIYEGPKEGRPSKIINLIDNVEIIER